MSEQGEKELDRDQAQAFDTESPPPPPPEDSIEDSQNKTDDLHSSYEHETEGDPSEESTERIMIKVIDRGII